MHLNESFFKRAYEPYSNLALHCFCKDIVISIVFIAVFLIIEAYFVMPLVFLCIALFLAAECLFCYKVAILGFVERVLKKVETQKLTPIKMKTEYDVSARFGNSIMPKLYPEKMGVNCYKIVCKNDEGQRCIIRFAGSSKKRRLIYELIQKNSDVYITYGKFSRVAFYFEGFHDINSKF